MARHDFFITAPDLMRLIEKKTSVILDASWHLPTSDRNAKAEFDAAHIPGARRYDIDVIKDAQSPLPHMLPTPQAFAAMMADLGVSNDSQIVLYDDSPLMSSARAFWMLKEFGAQNVLILEGGLQAWKTAGGALESGREAKPTHQGRFEARPAANVASCSLVHQSIGSADVQILDARPQDRFTGAAPEPREGMRSGHMPGALNLPFNQLLADGVMKSEESLLVIFQNIGLNLDQPVITSCGSGVTAAVLSLGLAMVGKQDVLLYDGSWSEWGALPNTPIIQGEN